MSDTAESGVFRSKLFGGFDKKQVFSFVDELKSKSNAEIERLSEELTASKSELESKSRQLDELKEKLSGIEQYLEEIDAVRSEQVEQANDKMRSAIDESEQLKSQMTEVQADYQKLGDACGKMKDSNAEVLAVNHNLTFENEALRQKSERQDKHIRQMDEKMLKYEQNNAEYIAEIAKLKAFVQELTERLQISQADADYKKQYEDINGRFIALKSENEALSHLLNEERARKEQCETALRELAAIDFSVFDNTSSRLSDLVDASKSIRRTVLGALEKCGELPDTAYADYSDIRSAENDELIRRVMAQIEQANLLIAKAQSAEKNGETEE